MLLAGVQNHQVNEMIVKDEEVDIFKKKEGFLAFNDIEGGSRQAKYCTFTDI